MEVKSENQSFIEEKCEAYHVAQVKLLVSEYLSLVRRWCISRLLIGWERFYICLMTWKTMDKFKLPFFPRISRYVNFFLFHLIMWIFQHPWILKNISNQKIIAILWLISSGKSLFNDFLFFWECHTMEKFCEIAGLLWTPMVFQRVDITKRFHQMISLNNFIKWEVV